MPCNDLISDEEIQNIYKDENIITSNELANRTQHPCIDNNTKKVYIRLYGEDNCSLLRQPIQRTYFRKKELLSKKDKNGKVVQHNFFVLYDEFQGRGIAKKVHEKEMDAYKRNRFIEIQLDATWDGLIVWKKLFFKFASKRDEDFIKIMIQRYLKEVKSMTKENIGKAIKNNPFSINVSYLKDDSNQNNNFIDWITRVSTKGQIVSKMCKEVLS